jgi:hypothetical protein
MATVGYAVTTAVNVLSLVHPFFEEVKVYVPA